jgi:Cyclin
MNCFDVGTEIIVAALIYTDRILTMNEEWLSINENNAKGFLHAALTLASKFYLDRFESDTVFHILLGNPSPLVA